MATTRVFRLTKARYAAHAFDGEGARRFGGRWSSPGRPVVYTAQSLALAALEILVHVREPALLGAYVFVHADVPEERIARVELDDLPEEWREEPPHPNARAVGDAWLAAGASLALRVPSVVVPGEFNTLVNPHHAEFGQVVVSKARAFTFDPRLGG